MKEKSRTEYSALNTTASMVTRVLTIVAGYFVRVLFTHTLSECYVGINGLFLDIINVLSLTELGVGTAITYALYKPISEKDTGRQKSLMRLYRNFYRIAALIVLCAGLLVIPFLETLVGDHQEVPHLTFIYLMYLANSVLSYLYIYKKTLIDAHQRLYIGVLYQSGFLLLQYAVQAVVLVLTRNFVLYLSVYILCTMGNNIAVSRKADRLYPYLKDKDVQELPQEERRSIFQNIRAMLMHKAGKIVVNNTDNLLLSSMVGIVSVAKYSNYFLLIGSVAQVVNQMFQGITASVGNLGVEEKAERIRRVFEASFFLGQWVYGVCAICLYELLNPFVTLSFGERYLFEPAIVLMLCVNFYVTGMRQATLVFRDSLGLFWFDRYKSVAEALINLIASILLARQWGAMGVFAGTFISTMTTSAWVEPWVLYRERLHEPVSRYYLCYLVYTAVMAGAAWVTDLLCRGITGGVIRVLLLRGMVCAVVPNLILLACWCRSAEFRILMNKGLFLLRNRLKKG